MAKTKRRVRLSPEERSTQLLTCAIRVFARHGLGRGGHAAVAREAGCSVPTVFSYFPTRDDLVTAVVDEVARFVIAQADRYHASGDGGPEAVLQHVRAFADSVNSDPDHARILLEWSTSVRDEGGVWQRYLDLQEQIVRKIARTIQRGQRARKIPKAVDAADAARLLVGCSHMIAQMNLTGQDPETVAHFVEVLVSTALRLPRPR